MWETDGSGPRWKRTPAVAQDRGDRAAPSRPLTIDEQLAVLVEGSPHTDPPSLARAKPPDEVAGGLVDGLDPDDLRRRRR